MAGIPAKPLVGAVSSALHDYPKEVKGEGVLERGAAGVGATMQRGAGMIFGTSGVSGTVGRVLGNADSEVLNTAAQALPTVYDASKAAVEAKLGHPQELKHLEQNYLQESAGAHLLKGELGKALHAAEQHPIGTALEASGAAGIVDRAAGALARAGALGPDLKVATALHDPGAVSVSRQPQTLLGNATEPLRPYDKGLAKRLIEGKHDPTTRPEGLKLTKALKSHFDRTEGALLRISRNSRADVLNRRLATITRRKMPIPGIDGINLYAKGILSDPSVLNAHGTPLYRDQLSQLVEHHAMPVPGETAPERVMRESNMAHAQRLLEEVPFQKDPQSAYKATLQAAADKRSLEPELAKHGIYTPEQMRTAKVVPAFQFHYRDQQPFVEMPPPFNDKGIAFHQAVRAHNDAQLARSGSLVALKRARAEGIDTTVARAEHATNVAAEKTARTRMNALMPKDPYELHESPFTIAAPRRAGLPPSGERIRVPVDRVYKDLEKKGVKSDQLAFVTTRPYENKDAAFYRPGTQKSAGAKITPGHLTGSAFTRGLYDPSYDAVVRQHLTDQAIVGQARAVGYKNANYALTKTHAAKLIEQKLSTLPAEQQATARALIAELRTGTTYFEPKTVMRTHPSGEKVRTVVSPWQRAKDVAVQIEHLHPDLRLEPGRLAHPYAPARYLDALAKNSIEDIHDRLDPNMWVDHRPQTQFPTNERDQHSLDSGEIGLFHKGLADRMKQYENDTGSSTRNAVRHTMNAWRRANVAYSVRHVPGLLQEVGVRALVNKIGPMSYMRGVKAYEDAMRAAEDATYAKANPQAALNADRLRAMSGGTIAAQTEDLGRHVNENQLWGTRAGKAIETFNTARDRRITGGPLRAAQAAIKVYSGFTTQILHVQRALLERPSELAGLGKHLNDEARAITGKSIPVLKAVQKAQAQVAKGILDQPALDSAARSLVEYWGNWTALSPAMKGWTSASPFLNWYVNSLKFIYHTMPVHHPIQTGLLAALEGATSAQRKLEGQGYEGPFVPHPNANSLAERQQGSIPIGHGFVADQQYYTPTGAVSGGVEGAIDSLFPYASDAWAIMHGSDPLTGRTLEDSNHQPITNAEKRVSLALLSILESFVPAYRIAKEMGGPQTESERASAREKEDPLGKALGISPKLWKAIRPLKTEQAYTQSGEKHATPSSSAPLTREPPPGTLREPTINTATGGARTPTINVVPLR